jgi:Predicted Peptidoglycan domain
MKRISETVLLESVRSLRETMALIEGGFNANTRQDAFGDVPDAIGATEHPMQNFSNYMNAGKDNVNNAVGDLASGIGHSIADPLKQGIPVAKDIGRSIGRVGQGVGTAINRAAHGDFADHPEDRIDPETQGMAASTNAGDAGDIANNMLNAPHAYSAPTPQAHQFNPSDTSYAQDHPPVDDLSGPSDLDAVHPYSTAPHADKPHPAGQPKTPKAKFDPAVQKLQYELQAKGYPIKADGILGPKTQQAIDWENQSEPFDNTQGDFDHSDPIAEHVTFSQGDSLARIIQLARG